MTYARVRFFLPSPLRESEQVNKQKHDIGPDRQRNKPKTKRRNSILGGVGFGLKNRRGSILPSWLQHHGEPAGGLIQFLNIKKR